MNQLGSFSLSRFWKRTGSFITNITFSGYFITNITFKVGSRCDITFKVVFFRGFFWASYTHQKLSALSAEQRREIFEKYRSGVKQTSLAVQYNVFQTLISKTVKEYLSFTDMESSKPSTTTPSIPAHVTYESKL